MISVSKSERWTISTDYIKEALLFLYLIIPFSSNVVKKILSVVGISEISIHVTIIPIIFLYICLCMFEGKLLVIDFWAIYFLVSLFFLLTYLFHPEYEYWYARSKYGVWDYVLRPDNGIFIYLFLRLINDPKVIIRTIKASAWPMYLWYGYCVLQALKQGYWVDYSNLGYEIHLSYNLALGYNLLIFTLPFLLGAFQEKKRSDILGSIIGIGMMLVGGSRGPFLDIAVFILIYLLIKVNKSKNKVFLSFSVVIGTFLIWVGYPVVLRGIAVVLEKLNLPSRFVTKVLMGGIMDDSGRSVIWSAAVGMIKRNPLGYGAMGSRHELAQYIYVAHPHQFFLEVLIDFGVIVGTLFLVWLSFYTIKLFIMKGQDEWKWVFLVFFARACQLLLSLTFWHSIALWGALAVGVCMTKAQEKGLKYVG